ncbi:hypothetical protein BLA13014_00804 [Burkholderia aenigmatica]|uniref:Uncharacterized protein n=1 Tax=Burkholderia aenigmatica TaxID=2015348 RepID=A0A6P2HYA3_9BURK|nr:hypothetical protein BLA13014_00804 [Burkholderia aenigmatica]
MTVVVSDYVAWKSKKYPCRTLFGSMPVHNANLLYARDQYRLGTFDDDAGVLQADAFAATLSCTATTASKKLPAWRTRVVRATTCMPCVPTT